MSRGADQSGDCVMHYDWDGKNEPLYDLSIFELLAAALRLLALWR